MCRCDSQIWYIIQKKKNNKKWYVNVRFDLAVAYSLISFIFIIPDNQKYPNIKRIWKTSINIWYTITHPYLYDVCNITFCIYFIIYFHQTI